MEYSPEGGTYSTGCRCGGSYSITEEDMEGGVVDTVCCSTCSLAIRVLYQQLAEGNEREGDREGKERSF